MSHGSPSDGIQEGLEAFHVVEAREVGKTGALQDSRTGFEFPHDLDVLTQRIVFQRGETHDVLGDEGGSTVLPESATVHFGDTPEASANLDHLSRLRNHGHHFLGRSLACRLHVSTLHTFASHVVW